MHRPTNCCINALILSKQKNGPNFLKIADSQSPTFYHHNQVLNGQQKQMHVSTKGNFYEKICKYNASLKSNIATLKLRAPLQFELPQEMK